MSTRTSALVFAALACLTGCGDTGRDYGNSLDAGSGGSGGDGGVDAGGGGSSGKGGTDGGSAGSSGDGGADAGAGGAGGGAGAGAGGGGAGGGGGSSACAAACTSDCRCGAGEGGCSSASQCAEGLICVDGGGIKFGSTGSVCLPAHCDNNAQDDDETSPDCGGACGCLARFDSVGLFARATQSWATAVSGNGQVVVGYTNSLTVGEDAIAFRWTEAAGIEEIASNTSIDAVASAANFDGGIVVGEGSIQGYLWSDADGQFSFDGYSASDITADGAFVLGVNYDSAPVIWAMPDATPEVLGGEVVQAHDLTNDGQYVVGGANPGTGVEPMIWFSVGGARYLPMLPGGFTGVARAITPVGTVIVGVSQSSNGAEEAFRWVADTTFEGVVSGLGDLPGGSFGSSALAVSDDGSIVVGYGTTDAGREAFIWDGAGGMRTVRDELEAHGYELPSGWGLLEARGISADGSVIVGTATDSNGDAEGWRVVLQ